MSRDQPVEIRIHEFLAEHGEPPNEVDATEIAMYLVDEDVAAGEYEGCSDVLELAYIEYEIIAKRLLNEGS